MPMSSSFENRFSPLLRGIAAEFETPFHIYGEDGIRLCIRDTGAHGHAMGLNYNGRLRPKELLLHSDGRVELIRRAETIADHLATLDFEPKTVGPDGAALRQL